MGLQRLNQTQTTPTSSTALSEAAIKPSEHPLLQLQATMGNRAINQWLAARKNPDAQQPTQAKASFQGLSHELMGRLVQSNLIQAKLAIGRPGNKYEQEADEVAAAVTGQLHNSIDQVSCPKQPFLRLQTSSQQAQKQSVAQQSSNSTNAATANLETGIHQAKGKGQPLPTGIRASMEQAFAVDFGNVRIHTDARADQLNRSIHAHAFTTGQDIFFRQTAYNPSSRYGRQLIAHELTHVIQQNGTVEQPGSELLTELGQGASPPRAVQCFLVADGVDEEKGVRYKDEETGNLYYPRNPERSEDKKYVDETLARQNRAVSIQEELPQDEFTEDFLDIQALLADETQVGNYFLELSLEIDKRCEEQKIKPTRALSLILQELERKHGFRQIVPIYTGFVTRDDFLAGLRGGVVAKDVGAGPMHGEHTHRIQWYIIMRAYEEDDLFTSSDHTPLEVYQAIGNSKYVDELKTINVVGTMWDQLVDTPPSWDKKNERGFAKPEHFMNQLTWADGQGGQTSTGPRLGETMGQMNQFLTEAGTTGLTNALITRRQKRAAMSQEQRGFEFEDYQKKLFKKYPSGIAKGEQQDKANQRHPIFYRNKEEATDYVGMDKEQYYAVDQLQTYWAERLRGNSLKGLRELPRKVKERKFIKKPEFHSENFLENALRKNRKQFEELEKTQKFKWLTNQNEGGLSLEAGRELLVSLIFGIHGKDVIL